MRSLLPLFLAVLLFSACGDDDEGTGTPRPRGYLRLALPEKKYTVYHEDCPFSFEIPEYSKMYHSAAPHAEPCWRDLYFPDFKGTLYLSYKDIENDTMIRQLINESWELVNAHNQMAGGMRDSAIIRPDAHVYGSVQSLSGNAATQVMFYLTDSTKHFIRGSLYFYATPNKDSIAPVLEFIKKDVYHLAQTLQWTDGTAPKITATATPASNSAGTEKMTLDEKQVETQLTIPNGINQNPGVQDEKEKKKKPK